jgi:hypothetical protein
MGSHRRVGTAHRTKAFGPGEFRGGRCPPYEALSHGPPDPFRRPGLTPKTRTPAPVTTPATTPKMRLNSSPGRGISRPPQSRLPPGYRPTRLLLRRPTPSPKGDVMPLARPRQRERRRTGTRLERRRTPRKRGRLSRSRPSSAAPTFGAVAWPRPRWA